MFIGLFAGAAAACTCSLGTVKHKLENHTSVFLGTVSEVKRLDEKSSRGEQRIQVSFSVERRWKGKDTDVMLDTWDNKISCEGYWFKEGLRYLVFARPGKNGLTVWYCGGVIQDSSKEFKEHIEFLDGPREDSQNEDDADPDPDNYSIIRRICIPRILGSLLDF